jgi:hypothetical protein
LASGEGGEGEEGNVLKSSPSIISAKTVILDQVAVKYSSLYPPVVQQERARNVGAGLGIELTRKPITFLQNPPFPTR